MRVAIITGAGSGIGRAVALALAKRSYRLVLAGRRADALEETAGLCGGETLCVPTDVTQKGQATNLVTRTTERFGRLDLLFNNAGVAAGGPIDALSEEVWRRVIDTNLHGAFFCLQAAFAAMKTQDPQGGRIINNGSIAAVSPRPNTIAYTASKHAVSGLTKSCSLEGRPFDIACCQIDIGNAASAMGAATAQQALQANGALATEPMMDVAHVGEAVAFMDSLPLEANIQFMTLMATKMPFIGRG